jgi:ribosomal protein S4
LTIKHTTNRRCAKTYHKKYRLYGCDIWGRLAIKKRDNFITNLVYQSALQKVREHVKHFIRKSRRRMWKTLYSKRRKQKKFFSYRIDTKAMPKRKKRIAFKGQLLQLRKIVSLFYGGNLIRIKTMRRYGKMTGVKKNLPYFNTLNHYETAIPYNTYTSIVESRLDVLLLRSSFVDSIYKARSLILNNQCKVLGYNRITRPGFLVKKFQFWGFRNAISNQIKANFLTRLKKHTIIGVPSYIVIIFSKMIAFKSEDPISSTVKYPFSDKSAGHIKTAYKNL